MKRFIIAFLLISLYSGLFSQDIEESTRKKFNIGVDLFTDIWLKVPDGVVPRTINQGINVFGMYNHQFNKSNFSGAVGIGLGAHNFYSNAILEDISADSVFFTPIPDDINYRKSKVGFSYLDFPFELRFKTKSEFRLAIGFKLGVKLDARTKYKGDHLDGSGREYIDKQKQVSQMEKVRFGPTFRLGYKWANVFGYYSVTKPFTTANGPPMHPVSIGITLMPF